LSASRKKKIMSNVYVEMKNGEKKEFLHRGRAGGSYTVSLRLVEGWAIIEDEWGKTTAIPREDIKEIRTEPHRRGW